MTTAVTSNSVNSELELRLKRSSALIGWGLVILSVINLVGWSYGIDWMAPPYSGYTSMKVSAAIGFLLGGLSLAFMQFPRRFWLLSYFFSMLLFAVSLMAMMIHIRGIEQYQLLDKLVSPAPTALFIIAALGLVLAGKGRQDLPAIFVFTSGSLGFFSRLFGIRVFHEHYSWGVHQVEMNTFLSFLPCFMLAALGLGILFSNPKHSLNGLLCSTTRGGFVTRRILPLAVALPMIWAAVTTAGERAYLYNQQVRWALFVTGTILSFCSLTCHIAKRLDWSDKSRLELAEKRADIIFSLAHDLKVPLIGATQSLDLLLREALGKLQQQQRTLLSVLRDSMNDQLWMIENLVYEYQTEEGKEKINCNPCLVHKLLDDCLEKMTPVLMSKNLEFSVEHQCPEIFISADSVALRRVINNLLHNAAKHSSKNGRIEIKSDAADGHYRFAVWNDGPVISEAHKSRLFERFWQSEEADNRYVGNGLGLYICRQIVAAHGGTISCSSETETGTAFIVSLPIAGAEE